MDEAIVRAVNAWAHAPWVAALAVALSSIWTLLAVGVPLAAQLLVQRRYLAIASVVVAIGVTDLFTVRVIKPLVDRPRPCHILEDLAKPARCGTGESFPSAHASNGFALAVSAGGLVPYGYAVLLPLAGAVAFSRVILGVHYLSDVAAGASVGALIGWLVVRRRRRHEAQKVQP